MKRILMVSSLCLAGLSVVVLAGCSGVKTAVSTVGGAVYNVASDAVSNYCALTPEQRAVVQLVVAGKVYNSGLCNIVNADKSLPVVLASVAQEKAPEVLDAAIKSAVANGELSTQQAEDIQALPPAPSTAPGPLPVTPPDDTVKAALREMRLAPTYG
jgi:hypothetical protein